MPVETKTIRFDGQVAILKGADGGVPTLDLDAVIGTGKREPQRS